MKFYLTLFFLLFANLSQAELQLYIFDCGRISLPDVSIFGVTEGETEVRELFVPCYLIKHDDHLMIWDAGLPLTDVGEAGGRTRYEVSLIDQLASMDIEPTEIDFVAYSHMHYDHVGAANIFKDATLIIQANEAEAAFDNPEEIAAYRPELYADIINSTRITLNGDHDVFGDGEVRIFSAPGHTPGHQVLYLELNEFGPLVLSGDLYHLEASRELRRMPTFNTDRDETFRSMDKIEGLIESSSATFWIEHNLELANSLDLAPNYYD